MKTENTVASLFIITHDLLVNLKLLKDDSIKLPIISTVVTNFVVADPARRVSDSGRPDP